MGIRGLLSKCTSIHTGSSLYLVHYTQSSDSYDVFEGVCDGLARVPALHDHRVLRVLRQFGFSRLQEALGALRLRFPADNNKEEEEEDEKD